MARFDGCVESFAPQLTQNGESPPGWPQVAQTVIRKSPAIDGDGSHSNARTSVGTSGIVGEQGDPVDHAPTTLALPVSLTRPPHPVSISEEYDIKYLQAESGYPKKRRRVGQVQVAVHARSTSSFGIREKCIEAIC